MAVVIELFCCDSTACFFTWLRDKMSVRHGKVTKTHMVMDNLNGIVSLSVCVELTKVIDQRSHTGREVNHPVH